MIKTLILCFFMCTSITVEAQHRFALETGIAGPQGYEPGLNSFLSDANRLTSYLKPCVAFTYQYKLTHHFFVGGKLSFYNYTYTYSYDHGEGYFNFFTSAPTRHYITKLQVNANYISVAPMLDLGLGRRGIVHFFVMPGLSILTNGTMKTDVISPFYYITTGGHDSVYSSSAHLNRIFFQVGYGISEQIPVGKNWKIILSQTAYSIAAGNIASIDGTNGLNPTVNYCSFQFGVMRRYHPKGKQTEKSEEPTKE